MIESVTQLMFEEMREKYPDIDLAILSDIYSMGADARFIDMYTGGLQDLFEWRRFKKWQEENNDKSNYK